MALHWRQRTRGAKIKGYKNTQDMPFVTMPVPEHVWVVMNQHAGLSCEVLVRKGDYVQVGQKIGHCDAAFGVPIYASASGTIAAFDEIVLPNGHQVAAIAIDTDGEQTVFPGLEAPQIIDHESLVKAMKESGMVGLGGAGFPTHIKYGADSIEQVDTLLVNGAECEPFLTTDYRVMLEYTQDILYGIDTILEHTGIERCVIAIEDNKPKAAEVLLAALGDREHITIAVLPTIYPQGAEKMIINQALGRVVPEKKLPADVGVVVNNITTIAELGHYFQTGMPLIAKKLTVDGGAIRTPQNIIAPIGTPISDIIKFCGGYTSLPGKILMGGPMMGFTLYDESYPLLINNNGLLFLDDSQSFRFEETACIACGRCTRACPMRLMPFQLKRAYERGDVEALEEYKINLCIECGCCSYVCPARQELVQSHRMSKALVAQHRQQEQQKEV